jgi:hypothetical protein
MATDAAEAFCLVARLAHIKGVLGVLQAVKQTKKQARQRMQLPVRMHAANTASPCLRAAGRLRCADGDAAGRPARLVRLHL